MGTQDIARWLIDNPQAWFELAGLVVEQKPDYARQIAQAFDDQFYAVPLYDNPMDSII